jgi:hypothetical protein
MKRQNEMLVITALERKGGKSRAQGQPGLLASSRPTWQHSKALSQKRKNNNKIPNRLKEN